MDKNEVLVLREGICRLGRRLFEMGFFSASDGNISARVDENTYLITPGSVSKGELTPHMLVLIDEKGNTLEAIEGCSPSSEGKLHLAVYQNRPDAGAVVHAHPLFSCVFACDGRGLDEMLLSEAALFLGPVPAVPYEAPGSSRLATGIVPYLDRHSALLLSNHGALTVGPSLTEAGFMMERLEFCAKVAYLSKAASMGQPLNGEQLASLHTIVRESLRPTVHPFL